ncbi:MAG: hypothetical protein LBR17_02025 [Bacteroidales bacterium]|jgi:hypothetical protein|nr:hypothetical protein [Bacteroidales bacterium]
MNTRKIFLIAIISGLYTTVMYAQTTPNKTEDYGLFGYPSAVKYMKFEADTATNPTLQRTSFIDDYLLNFNERRELIQRTNFINGAKDRVITLEYNNKRQLVKEILAEADGKPVSQTDYDYGYIGRVSQITVTEYPQSRAGANTVVYRETRDYNKKGQLEKKVIYGNGMDLSSSTSYFYGPQDSLISTLTTYGANKNVEKVMYKRDFKHDIVEVTSVRNDKQTRREEYDLNEKNQIATKRVYNAKNKLILTYNYEYDQHGYVLSEVAFDDKGVRTIDYHYKYEKDKFFNWTKCTMYDGWMPKYVEVRNIEYLDKQHFYDDMIDEETKRVIRQ